MAFEKGKSGNPSGRPKEKAFADALRLAVNREVAEGKKKLHQIAEKLVDCALAGESWAIQQVADRLDGKPSQSIEATIYDERDLSELSTEELLARTARILEEAKGGDRGAAASEDKSSDVRKLN